MAGDIDGEPSGDSVSAAFNTVMDGISEAKEALVTDLTTAAGRSEYGAIATLTDRLRRVDFFLEEVSRLQSEWVAIFQPVDPETAEAEAIGASPVNRGQPVGVPDQYELCGPTLQALRSMGGKGGNREIEATVIRQLQLLEEVTRQPHHGSHQTEFEWQLGWTRTILKTCLMVDNPQQGVWEITVAGSRQHAVDSNTIKSLYRRYLNQRRQPAGG